MSTGLTASHSKPDTRDWTGQSDRPNKFRMMERQSIVRRASQLRYSPSALVETAELILVPSQSIRSIHEKFSKDGTQAVRTVQKTVVIDFAPAISGSKELSGGSSQSDPPAHSTPSEVVPQVVAFPIVSPLKGTYAVVESVHSSATRTAGYLNYQDHSAVMLGVLLGQLYRTALPWFALDWSRARTSCENIEQDLIDIIICGEADACSAVSRIFDSSFKNLRACPIPLEARSVRTFHMLCSYAARRNVLFIDLLVEPSVAFEVTYTQRTPLSSDSGNRLRDRIRDYIGGESPRLSIPIPLACHTGDYHLEVCAPDGRFFSDQSVYISQGISNARVSEGGQMVPRLVHERTGGVQYQAVPGAPTVSNIMVVNAAGNRDLTSQSSELRAGFVMCEIPLGSSLPALTSSLITFMTLLVLLVASTSGRAAISNSEVLPLTAIVVIAAATMVGTAVFARAARPSGLSRFTTVASCMVGIGFVLWWVYSLPPTSLLNSGLLSTLVAKFGGLFLLLLSAALLAVNLVRANHVMRTYRFARSNLGKVWG